ncbi:MAG: hypothetical protein ACXVCH_00900, partial [Bdellovibrionota bacterium]
MPSHGRIREGGGVSVRLRVELFLLFTTFAMPALGASFAQADPPSNTRIKCSLFYRGIDSSGKEFFPASPTWLFISDDEIKQGLSSGTVIGNSTVIHGVNFMVSIYPDDGLVDTKSIPLTMTVGLTGVGRASSTAWMNPGATQGSSHLIPSKP